MSSDAGSKSRGSAAAISTSNQPILDVHNLQSSARVLCGGVPLFLIPYCSTGRSRPRPALLLKSRPAVTVKRWRNWTLARVRRVPGSQLDSASWLAAIQRTTRPQTALPCGTYHYHYNLPLPLPIQYHYLGRIDGLISPYVRLAQGLMCALRAAPVCASTVLVPHSLL